MLRDSRGPTQSIAGKPRDTVVMMLCVLMFKSGNVEKRANNTKL